MAAPQPGCKIVLITIHIAMCTTVLQHPGGLRVIRIALCCLFSVLMLLPQGHAQEWEVWAQGQDIASGTSSFTHITMRAEEGTGIPYVVYVEDNKVQVKKKIGATWVAVGQPVWQGSATYCRIFTTPAGQLVVTYIDVAADNRLAVRQLHEATGVWEPPLADESNLYVSEGSVTYAIGQFNATPRSSVAFDNGGALLVAFSDGAGFTPFVKKLTAQGWTTLGGGSAAAERALAINLAVDSSTNLPWLVYMQQPAAGNTTGPARVLRFDGNAWVPVPLPAQLEGGNAATGATSSIRHTAIAFNKDWNPVIAYFNTGSNNRATAALYNKQTGSWSLSGILSGRDAPAISLVRDARGNLFASFTDAMTNGSGRTLARVMMLPAGLQQWGELKNETVNAGVDEPANHLSLSVGNENTNPLVVYTKNNAQSIATPVVQAWLSAEPNGNDDPVTTPKQMERLNRGLVAVRTSAQEVYVGWRLLGTDAPGIAFNVYANGTRVNNTPITGSTNFVHPTGSNNTYHITPVVDGSELTPSESTEVLLQPYLQINLQRPQGGVSPDNVQYTYTPNDCSVGDLDGDGQYEIIVKWEPTNAKDNSQAGYTGPVYLDAYRLDGTQLWRINLGINIRAGAHYTQFMVYDFDGDGKAELACKTADGTIDGLGNVIGNAAADHRNGQGYILTGPEYLTMFNGMTGAAMQTIAYLPARGTVSSWGDNYGNRVDRFVAAVAYLDGQRPSLIMGRGYYTRLVRVAWDWRNGQFVRRWLFDSNQPGNGAHAGQGHHSMSVADVDGDCKHEVLNGSSTQNNNGTGLWANGLGHGDALHVADIDPDRPGLELWSPYESPASNGQVGAALLDARTGVPLFTVPVASDDVGRGLTADIDPRHRGMEVWASRGDLYSAKGIALGTNKPSMNFAIWWDADTLRELLDGTTISKWNWEGGFSTNLFAATGCLSNNGTKATPALSADLLGDWREEVIFRTADNNSLRIFTTTLPAQNRFYTLMHDPQYRVAIAWQNSGYNQPPHPGFYLGHGMAAPPTPNIYEAGGNALPLQWQAFQAHNQEEMVRLGWQTTQEVNTHHFAIERSVDGKQFTTLGTVPAKGHFIYNSYTYMDKNPPNGLSFYRLRQVDKDGAYSYSPVRTVNREVQQRFGLYPNPLGKGDKLHLHSRMAMGGSPLVASVTTSTGVLIASTRGSMESIQQSLNGVLQRQAAGLYFITLESGGHREVLRLLKR